MERVTTRELYEQMQNRIVLNLQDDEIICPECKGMRFVYVEENGKGYIDTCRRCYTGKLYVCKHCGEGYKTGYCHCKEASEERAMEFRMKQAKKDAEAFQKAEKIHYKDYAGKFIIDGSEYIKDIDDVGEWIYDLLTDGTEPPEYLWAVEKHQHISIDLKDVVSDKCEDGYEDMYSHLNTASPLISQAQELINQWEKEQGDSLCVFDETYRKAVIIKDLVEDIRKEIQSKNIFNCCMK